MKKSLYLVLVLVLSLTSCGETRMVDQVGKLEVPKNTQRIPNIGETVCIRGECGVVITINEDLGQYCIAPWLCHTVLPEYLD